MNYTGAQYIYAIVRQRQFLVVCDRGSNVVNLSAPVSCIIHATSLSKSILLFATKLPFRTRRDLRVAVKEYFM